MIRLLVFFSVLMVAISCRPLSNPALSKVEPLTGAEIEENVQVTMRDGVRLNTLVILPPQKSELGVPSILIRTPYKTEFNWGSALYQGLLAQGYAIIMQHERGRYFSEGEFRMLVGAREDGWDTMDWIVSQSWSNGSVGTYGCSSSGENQLKLASAGHPAHKAMVAGSAGVGVAQAGPFREQGNFWRGGVWQQGWMNYFHASMHQDWPQLPRGLSDEERQRTIGFFDLSNAGWKIPSSTYNKTRMHLPMIEIMEQLNAPRNEVNQYLMRGPVHESWSESRVSEGEMIAVPGLYFESLYDISARSTLAYFEWNRSANVKLGRKNQQLRLTQGGHCSFGRASAENEHAMIGDLVLGDMRYDYVEQTIDWFNRWMKPSALPNQLDNAYTAFLGYGQWLQTNRLPMKGSQAWYLAAKGRLTQQSPQSSDSVSYHYDPADPVPSLGGEIYGEGDDHKDGSFNQVKIQARDDVIVFSSEPVSKDVTLFGMTDVFLTVSSKQPDTDFTVKINDVYPDGKAFNIGNTIMRMRYREGLEHEVFMQPNTRYNIELPPIMLSRIIKKGHRIQVEVSSSNFPSYSRNLNTIENPYTSTEFAVATNTIYFGEAHKSMIRLPIYTSR